MTTNTTPDHRAAAINKAKATAHAWHAINVKWPMPKFRAENDAACQEVYAILAEEMTTPEAQTEKLLALIGRIVAK